MVIQWRTKHRKNEVEGIAKNISQSFDILKSLKKSL